MSFLDLLSRTRKTLFTSAASRSATGHAALDDPKWYRTERDAFPRLIYLKPEALGLAGVGGVYAIWNAGVRPQWVYAAKTDDLAESLSQARDDPDVGYYERNGGLYVTWSPIAEAYRDGVTAFLRAHLDPLITECALGGAPDPKAEPIPVLIPGLRPDS